MRKWKDALYKTGVQGERRDLKGISHESFGTASVVQKAKDAQTYSCDRLKQLFKYFSNFKI